MKHKGDMTEALAAERVGLVNRLKAAGGDDAPEQIKANLGRRIEEVDAELSKLGAAEAQAEDTKERRPGGRATSKRKG